MAACDLQINGQLNNAHSVLKRMDYSAKWLEIRIVDQYDL